MALTAISIVAGLATASASAAPRSQKPPQIPSRCSRLPGKDLLPNNPAVRLGKVRYVKRHHATRYVRYRWFACTSPGSRVYRVADVGAEDGFSNGVGIGPSAGTRVVIKVGGSNLTGDYYEATWRVRDAATGRSYVLWTFGAHPSVPSPRSLVLLPDGAAAAIFAPGGYEDGYNEEPFSDLPAGATTAVGTFDAGGNRTIRDTGGAEIAPGSLTLSGTVASWTHGAEVRSQDLAAPTR